MFKLKQSLSILEDLGFSAIDDSDDDSDESDPDEADFDSEEDEFSAESDSKAIRRLANQHKLSTAQMEEILAELESGRYRNESVNDARKDRMRKARAKATKGHNALPPTTNDDSSSKKAKKSAKSKELNSKPIFDLEEPEFAPSKPSSSKNKKQQSISAGAAPYDPLSAYGDPTALDYADAADKSARRKSLRFHTARIESTTRRREGARTNALGGDDDIPWRDLRRDKQQAVTELAIKQGRGQGGDDLDPNAPDDVDMEASRREKGKKRAREVDGGDDDNGAEEGANGYYELIKKRKKETKEEKKTAYEAERAANRSVQFPPIPSALIMTLKAPIALNLTIQFLFCNGRPDFTEDAPGGPRSLTRAILKNRGMTPRRSKSVRNPRVKKKERYEKAKKAMSSKQATFKGGLASLPGGRYEGEKTGISNVVKSVKL